VYCTSVVENAMKGTCVGWLRRGTSRLACLELNEEVLLMYTKDWKMAHREECNVPGLIIVVCSI
jgi:hypothetical protein